ncbi:MAG: hypothetical protein ABIF71_14735 [Planctomycetota bacterium]
MAQTTHPLPRGGYWSFYWPLALTSLVSLFTQQLQNATLARYPDAARELATFALAAGVFHLFDAALAFVPQMVTVLARSRASAAICRRFVLGVCLILTVPVLIIAIPQVGGPFVGAVFNISGPVRAAVLLYMALLAPNIVMAGLRFYYSGLVVQAQRTGVMTAINVMHLAVVLGMLLVGFHAGWLPVITIGGAQLAASVASLVALHVVAARCAGTGWNENTPTVTWYEVFDFFWPVALTSVMFSLSRPILYSFLGRLPEPEPVIAAMRVGFDCAMIFHNFLNQFRHLFATFGAGDTAGIRRFMFRVTAVVVTAMVVAVFTPLAHVVIHDLIGVQGPVLAMTRQVLMVMCLLPILVTVRNYFHGLAMVRRRTGPMGAGAVGRNAMTYLAAWALFSLGRLNHVTAAAVLVLGFAAETAVVILGDRLRRAPKPVVKDDEGDEES